MKIVNKGVLFAFFATLCAVTATYFYSYTMAASLSPEGDYVLVDISCGRFRVELGAIHQKGKVGAFSINISSISSADSKIEEFNSFGMSIPSVCDRKYFEINKFEVKFEVRPNTDISYWRARYAVFPAWILPLSIGAFILARRWYRRES